MAPQTATVAEILTAYRDGAMSRAQMLDAMRAYPWQPVQSSNPDPRYFSETAWEHMDWPQLGTVQEISSAGASGAISQGDQDAIYDVLRSLSG
jgi:hypothetical protein